MKFHNILSSKLPHINVFYIIIILNFIKICFLCIFKAWAHVRCTFFLFLTGIIPGIWSCYIIFVFVYIKCVFVLDGTGTRQLGGATVNRCYVYSKQYTVRTKKVANCSLKMCAFYRGYIVSHIQYGPKKLLIVP